MAGKIAKKEYAYTHGRLFSRICDDSLHVRGPIRATVPRCPRKHCDRKSLSTVRVSNLLRAFVQALGKPDFQVC